MSKLRDKKWKKRCSSNNGQNGITLIALVITIIVLLILAGISIMMLTGDNSILKNATDAKEATEESEVDEKVKLAVAGALSSEPLGDITDENIKKTLAENMPTGTEYTVKGDETTGWTVTVPSIDKIYTISSTGAVGEAVSREGLKVGDYINYTPDTVEAGYPSTSLASTITGLDSNSDIIQDNLNWRILRIYDDGRMDLIGDITSQSVYFSGALGYNNGVYVMNDICEKLYSRGNIKARSINYEDIEHWLTDEGKKVRDEYTSGGSVVYGGTQTYPDYCSYYPLLYAQENGSGINTTDVKTNGIGISEEYYSAPTTDTYTQASGGGLTVTQTYWYSGSNSMNSTYFGDVADTLYSNTFYWVASRYADCNVEHVDRGHFGLFRAGTDLSGDFIFNSGNYTYYDLYNYRLRPVVSLGSGVKVTACSGTNSADNPHTISQY